VDQILTVGTLKEVLNAPARLTLKILLFQTVVLMLMNVMLPTWDTTTVGKISKKIFSISFLIFIAF